MHLCISVENRSIFQISSLIGIPADGTGRNSDPRLSNWRSLSSEASEKTAESGAAPVAKSRAPRFAPSSPFFFFFPPSFFSLFSFFISLFARYAAEFQ